MAKKKEPRQRSLHLVKGITPVAFHEAGHHVLAFRFGMVTDVVTIKPDPSGGTLGTSMSEGAWSDGSMDREQVLILLAGLAAERMVAPGTRAEDGAGKDYARARELLEGGSVAESLEMLESEAAALVAQDRSAIEALAAALLEYETLPGDEADVVVECVDCGQDWRAGLQGYRERFKRAPGGT
jgi:ATP-dependent Zn protease